MSEIRIASRYAKSLLELAQEKKSVPKILKDIEMFVGLCESNRDLVLMLRNPIINHWQKLAVLKKIFEKKVDKMTMSFFEIVTRKNRERYLLEVARQFIHQYNEAAGIIESTVTTAVPLSAALKKEISGVVQKLAGDKKVELTELVDPEVIGGFLLKIGDKQVDDTVGSKLRELKLQFKQG